MKIIAAGLLLACHVAASAAGAADAQLGAAEFKRSCASCHSADASQSPMAGPGLYGVAGRRLASAPRYNYSAGMDAAGAAGTIWTAERLVAFLADPARTVPGTTMPGVAVNAAQRANLVAYLATLHGAPAPTATAGSPGAVAAAPASAATTPSAAAPAGARDSAASAPGSGGWQEDVPGRQHHFTAADLPAPYRTNSAGNSPRLAARPANALPRVPAGFQVSAFATGTDRGRLMLRAPNGDLFLSVPSQGEIRILRPDGKAQVFASGLTRPYGMALYPAGPHPQYLYVANVNSVVRIPYAAGDLKARAPAETVVAKLADTTGGHSTRSVQFSRDGKIMFVSVGSGSNVADTIPRTPPAPLPQWERQHGLGAAWGDETDRALVLAFDPDGKRKRTFATGLRNCVGMEVHPDTGALLCSVNERDALGDNLPFDYITEVRPGAFYGWPWYYIGSHEDPRLAGVRPDLKDKVTVPDVLIQAHSAPLGFTIYHAPPGATAAFPKEYEGEIFLALHGSWNRALRSGYKVVRVFMKDGHPTGQYEDFLTGMVLNDTEVWGRPAAVAVAADGALLVADDAGSTIWRVAPRK